jgi:hypothetical protein
LHIVQQRREKLRGLIRADGYLPVADACRRIGVSETTTRRDLIWGLNPGAQDVFGFDINSFCIAKVWVCQFLPVIATLYNGGTAPRAVRIQVSRPLAPRDRPRLGIDEP